MSDESTNTPPPAHIPESASTRAVWPTYSRLLGYALRYRARIIAMILFSVLVGLSLSSMILTVGTVVNIIYLDEVDFEEKLESSKAQAVESSETAEKYLGWAPEDLDGRIERFAVSMREDRSRAMGLLAVFIVGLTLLGAISRFLQEYYAGAVGVSVSTELQKDMFSNLMNLSHRFFDKRAAGEIVARFTNDVFMVNQGLLDVFTRLFREPIKIFFLLAIAMSVDVYLTLIVLFILSPLIFIVMGIAKGVKNSVHRSLTKVASLASIVTETVQGISVIKGFGMEAYENKRMDAELMRLRRHMKNIAKAQAAIGPATETMLVLGIGAFLIVSERQVSAGDLAPGELVILFGALAATLDPLRKLSRLMNMVQLSATSASRVFDFIDYEPDVAECSDAVEAPVLADALRFEDVHFSYDEREVLSGVSFDVKRGEMVALVGFSGSGKSTIAKLVPRFYDPNGGRITLDGKDIRDVTLASLRGQMSIVTQETILFSESVRQNIGFGREDISDERIAEAARAAHADGFIDDLPEGMDTVLAESGGNLSGGQRQRLAIARAIIKDPAILILDEATSSLDSESEKAILDAIDHFVVGRTTLVIAHRLSTVRKADRIVVIEEGRVAEQGTHDELLAREGVYSRLYRLQFADHREAGAS